MYNWVVSVKKEDRNRKIGENWKIFKKDDILFCCIKVSFKNKELNEDSYISLFNSVTAQQMIKQLKILQRSKRPFDV